MGSDESRISIRDISGGTFAFGDHAHVESHHTTGAEPADETSRELLLAVRELRADLARVRATEQTATLDAALADTEDEITRTGRAAPTRRERLRELLADSQALLTVLASAGAVAGLVGL
ncbi:hypothetical protein [Streptomyces sp. NPDC047000]|uniref:hypothetical protein n=1 Tax=Streptomyces sp. NPDC047000 TaxID=3155474 RepID=UPI0033DBD25D